MKLHSLLMIAVAICVMAPGCAAIDDVPSVSSRIAPEFHASSKGSEAPDANLDLLTTATGRVLTAERVAIPDALIEPSPLDGQPWPEYESLRKTDADGRYQLPLPPGRWHLSISAQGFQPTSLLLKVPTKGVIEADVMLEKP